MINQPVITIKQPWASLIVEGIKDIENRTWKLPEKYKGKRVLIHAGMYQKLDKMPLDMVFTEDQLRKLYEIYTELELCKRLGPFGAIIGSVEIVDCVINHPSIWAEKSFECTRPNRCEQYNNQTGCKEGMCINYYKFEKPIYNWVLANPILFPEPITVKGKQSFWKFDKICAEPEEKDGELFCHCQLPVKEENQVWLMIDHFRCHYCEGRWCH